MLVNRLTMHITATSGDKQGEKGKEWHPYYSGVHSKLWNRVSSSEYVFNHQSIRCFSSRFESHNAGNEKGTHHFITRFPKLSSPSIRQGIWGSEGFRARQSAMVLCRLARTVLTYISTKGFFIFLFLCYRDEGKYLSLLKTLFVKATYLYLSLAIHTRRVYRVIIA